MMDSSERFQKISANLQSRPLGNAEFPDFTDWLDGLPDVSDDKSDPRPPFQAQIDTSSPHKEWVSGFIITALAACYTMTLFIIWSETGRPQGTPDDRPRHASLGEPPATILEWSSMDGVPPNLFSSTQGNPSETVAANAVVAHKLRDFKTTKDQTAAVPEPRPLAMVLLGGILWVLKYGMRSKASPNRV